MHRFYQVFSVSPTPIGLWASPQAESLESWVFSYTALGSCAKA